MTATRLNNQDYENNISGSDPEKFYAAIDIYPERVEAYEKLIEYCKNRDVANDEIARVGNTIQANADELDVNDPRVAKIYYDMGKLYFSEFDGGSSFKSRAVNARDFFQVAAESSASYDKKEVASCYYSICRFMTNQSTTSENSLEDYNALFAEIENAMQIIEKASDGEANYDKMSLYYVTMLLLNDQAEYMASVGVERQTVLDMMDRLYDNTGSITSTLSYVNELQDMVDEGYEGYVTNINAKYTEVEKRQQGGR